MNLPVVITIAGKGSITYLYDATGNRLSKTVLDNTGSLPKTKVTNYAGIFIYKQDSLELIVHEEGRIRPIYKTGVPINYAYDYFEKDHLGNVRTVLTDQTDFTMYTATMETEATAKESILFSNVEETRVEKPSGYPEDKTTEENRFVAKLNAKRGGKKVGPSLVLRVMAGDTIQIKARVFYKSQGPTDNNAKAPVEDMLAGLMQAFGGNANESGSHASMLPSDNRPFDADFYNKSYQRLKEKNHDNNQSDRPQAYLNFVLFDDDFLLVDNNSGIRQVKANPDQLQELSVEKTAVEKNGFLYVYTSNESPLDVFFDNVVLGVNSGPLLEETHYYPFGLTMAGISTNALKGVNYPENRMKFNIIELTADLGLETYDAFYRNLDPQIGRWKQLDPKCEFYYESTPYNHVFNNPISIMDPLGDDTTLLKTLPDVWHEFDPATDVVQIPGVTVTPGGAHSTSTSYSLFGLSYGFGYKILPSRSWLEDFILGPRTYGNHYIDQQGRLSLRKVPMNGIPPDIGLSGPNYLRIGNSIRNVIKEFKWSSKTVRLAAKAILRKETEVTVASRSEAEELFMGIFHNKGFINTSGMSATEAKAFYKVKKGTYHWDEAVDGTGRIINHGAANPHGVGPHLQIHDFDGLIYRIFY